MAAADIESGESPGGSRERASASAAGDLEYIRGVMARTERAVDAHAHHFVVWGVLVFFWYPLSNWLQLEGRLGAMAAVTAAAVVTGAVLSTVFELRLRRRGQRPDTTVVGAQIAWLVWGPLVGAIVLSAAGPPLGLVPGPNVPLVWGLAYAVMTYGLGVVYRRSFLFSAVAIFLAFMVALRFPEFAGYVLGPVMGLGLFVPGLAAVARERGGTAS